MSIARTFATLVLILGAASACGGDDKPAASPDGKPGAPSAPGKSEVEADEKPEDKKAAVTPAGGAYFSPMPPSTVIGSATPPSPSAPGFKTARVAIAGGTITTSEEISFKPGTSELAPGVGTLLDEVALTIRNHPELRRVRIEGHCAIAREGQAQLTDSQLQVLSTARAGYVKTYLIARGVSAQMLSYEGFGAAQPLVKNDSDESQAKNRRVAFIVMEKADPAKPDQKP